MNSESKNIIRKSSVAGSRGFYPSDPNQLREDIKRYLSDADLLITRKPFGLIAPHAGYFYSGPVAGWAYRQIEGYSFKRVVVIAPSHAEAIPFNSVMPEGGYETPLGVVEVDSEFAGSIANGEKDSIRLSYRGHADGNWPSQEHSLEVQLPFLQYVIGDFKLVPIVMGLAGWQASRELGDAIAENFDDETLIVASSDLSHYHPYDDANRIDRTFIEKLSVFDAEGIAEGCQSRMLEACGGAPVAALLAAARSKGLNKVEILRHRNSGDVLGGVKEQVVGYLAAAVIKDDEKEEKQKSEHRDQSGSGVNLDEEEKNTLLSMARNSIARALTIETSSHEDLKITPELRKKRGMFVTLKDRGRLRGCIGRLIADEPLDKLVGKVARQAAFDDPRFMPLSRQEYKNINMEITILGPMIKTTNPSEIEVGKHGILIRRGVYQGLLLPQVATEQNWDREQFLENTCYKAGLPADAWKSKQTEILIFTADVFGE